MDVFGHHPATVLMIAGYGYGVHLINIARQRPMWAPRMTGETQQEGQREAAAAKPDRSNGRLGAEFAGLAAITAGAGYGVSQFGIALSQATGLSETTVGGLFTAISTSLPNSSPRSPRCAPGL